MKKRIKKREDVNKLSARVDIAVVILSAILLCAICAGCITASCVTEDSAGFLNEYISKNALYAGQVIAGREQFFKSLITLVKYPAIVFSLGYTAFGTVLIPGVLFFRGFFLSFSVASVIRVLGYKGLAAALSVYGLQALVSIPCTLIIAAKAMRASQRFFSFAKAGKEQRVIPHAPDGYFTCFFICIICLTLCALLEVLLVPKLSALSYTLIF